MPPQNLHLTLSYIGEASNILLEDLEDVLSSLAAHAVERYKSFHVKGLEQIYLGWRCRRAKPLFSA